jgi:hypothetical protein
MHWLGAAAVVPVAIGMLAALVRLNRAAVARMSRGQHIGPGARFS